MDSCGVWVYVNPASHLETPASSVVITSTAASFLGCFCPSWNSLCVVMENEPWTMTFTEQD